MRGALTVPLTDESGKRVSHVTLLKPQYAGRLSFERLSLPSLPIQMGAVFAGAPEVVNQLTQPECFPASADGFAGDGDLGDGAPMDQEAVWIPVEMDWHSGSAVLSDTACVQGPRFLLASTWRRQQ